MPAYRYACPFAALSHTTKTTSTLGFRLDFTIQTNRQGERVPLPKVGFRCLCSCPHLGDCLREMNKFKIKIKICAPVKAGSFIPKMDLR